LGGKVETSEGLKEPFWIRGVKLFLVGVKAVMAGYLGGVPWRGSRVIEVTLLAIPFVSFVDEVRFNGANALEVERFRV
jgi:hypothetical protein